MRYSAVAMTTRCLFSITEESLTGTVRDRLVAVIPQATPVHSEQANPAAHVDKHGGPLQPRDRANVSRSALKREVNFCLQHMDVPVISRSATCLILIVLLVLQSVVPCCAISRLLANRANTEVSSDRIVCGCSHCEHSFPERHVPVDDKDSRNDQCPFCGGLMLHAPSDNSVVHEPTTSLVFGVFPCKLACVSSQRLCAEVITKPLCFGQPFFDTGMRC